MQINYNKSKLIITWVVFAFTAFFIFGALAAILQWIDRDWAESIAEYSAMTIFVLVVALLGCFLLDRPDGEKSENESGPSEADADLEIEAEDFASDFTTDIGEL